MINDSDKLYIEQSPPGMTPQIFAPGIVSTGAQETDVTISPDLKEIYFTRTSADWYSIIHVSVLREGTWTDPEQTSFSGTTSKNYPFISPDGQKLFFDSVGKSGQPADRDLWMVLRSGECWIVPQVFDSTVNTPATESFASVSARGNLYFCSKREDGMGGMDIYQSVITESGSSIPKNLGSEINSANNDFHPFIDPDERYLIFDSQRPGGYGSNDLYISFKLPDGKWSQTVNMGPEVNSIYSDMRPYVSPDGKYFFFCSNRIISGKDGNDPDTEYENQIQNRMDMGGKGSQDIYWMDAQIIDQSVRLKN